MDIFKEEADLHFTMVFFFKKIFLKAVLKMILEEFFFEKISVFPDSPNQPSAVLNSVEVCKNCLYL